MPISKFSTLTEMKDYVRKNKLNKGEIKLSMKKSVMLAALDKGGHIHTGARGADAPKKKATPVKKTTPSNTKAAYKEGYDEGYEQGIDDVEGDVVGDDGGEILDPKAPIVTDYKNDDDRKAVIKGWKEGYLAATKKKTTPKKKASPSVVVDDDKSKEYLNKLKADLTAFNKKYTAAKFKKLDSKGRSKLLKEYNDDSAIIQKGNLEFKKKITDKNGNPTKFYNDYTTMIKTIAEGYGKFSRVRKNIKKLI